MNTFHILLTDTLNLDTWDFGTTSGLDMRITARGVQQRTRSGLKEIVRDVTLSVQRKKGSEEWEGNVTLNAVLITATAQRVPAVLIEAVVGDVFNFGLEHGVWELAASGNVNQPYTLIPRTI